MLDILVDESETLALHRLPRIIDTYVDDVNLLIASQTLAEVHLILDQSIRNPTPYYETQLIVEPEAGGYVVHDRGIIYGPWLEGVSARNQATRFKGYAAFRKARQVMEIKTAEIMQRELDRVIGGLQ